MVSQGARMAGDRPVRRYGADRWSQRPRPRRWWQAGGWQALVALGFAGLVVLFAFEYASAVRALNEYRNASVCQPTSAVPYCLFRQDAPVRDVYIYNGRSAVHRLDLELADGTPYKVYFASDAPLLSEVRPGSAVTIEYPPYTPVTAVFYHGVKTPTEASPIYGPWENLTDLIGCACWTLLFGWRAWIVATDRQETAQNVLAGPFAVACLGTTVVAQAYNTPRASGSGAIAGYLIVAVLALLVGGPAGLAFTRVVVGYRRGNWPGTAPAVRDPGTGRVPGPRPDRTRGTGITVRPPDQPHLVDVVTRAAASAAVPRPDEIRLDCRPLVELRITGWARRPTPRTGGANCAICWPAGPGRTATPRRDRGHPVGRVCRRRRYPAGTVTGRGILPRGGGARRTGSRRGTAYRRPTVPAKRMCW